MCDVLDAEVSLLARLVGAERRIEAVYSRGGLDAELREGAVRQARDCEIVRAVQLPEMAARISNLAQPPAPAPNTVAVPVLLSNGRLFGVLGVRFAPEASVDLEAMAVQLAAIAAVLTAGLDLLEADNTLRQEARGFVAETIRERRFYPAFQPVMDLRTDSVFFYEGLSRLEDGFGVTLGQLLQIAERVGHGPRLEIALARCILEKRPLDHRGEPMAVNLSEEALTSPEFQSFLGDGVPAGTIIELTEHAHLRNHEDLAGRILRLRAMGLRVAIDDTGAGFTSLRNIIDLKPDILKIANELTANVDSDPNARALIRYLQAFAEDRQIALVVEGVERAAQRDALVAQGVRYVQGFAIGVPRSDTRNALSG